MADPGGASGACPLPTGPNSFVFTHLHQSAASDIGVPQRSWRPPNGKSWIRHCSVKTLKVKECTYSDLMQGKLSTMDF